jgi:cell division protein FtsB
MAGIGNSKKKSPLGKMSLWLAALLVVAVVFSLVSALSKELYREYKIKKDIEVLKTEIQAMEKDNYELSQLLEYYKTDEYKEAEARKRLNLKAEGEQVVMIDEKESSAEEIAALEEAAQQAGLSNRIRWWNYFFASRDDS